MNSLQTILAIGFCGLLATPAASMEKRSPIVPAVALEGTMSLNIASSFPANPTHILQLDRIESSDFLRETNNSFSELGLAPEFNSMNTGSISEPSAGSLQISVVQF